MEICLDCPNIKGSGAQSKGNPAESQRDAGNHREREGKGKHPDQSDMAALAGLGGRDLGMRACSMDFGRCHSVLICPEGSCTYTFKSA
jgi:hypothetical protein